MQKSRNLIEIKFNPSNSCQGQNKWCSLLGIRPL